MKLVCGEYDNHIKSIEFYQLKREDRFKIGRTKYKKISDDAAIDMAGKERLFWPQDTVWLLTPTKRERLWIRYPLTEYVY